MKRHAPATGRNREPILEVLKRWVKPGARVLEIASGSGEHAVFLAPALGVAQWQPTDIDPEALASIDAWCADVPPILPAVALDVTKPWPAVACDVITCANMIHIAPWTATLGLFEGAGKLLARGGLLYLYGPYVRNGRMVPSNVAFDQSLRARNPEWGIRSLEDVEEIGRKNDLQLNEVVEMPANNLSLVFEKGGTIGGC